MALVLTLKDGDFIFIGPDITIRSQWCKGTPRWRLAIEAPKELEITTSNYLKKQQRKQGELK